MTAAAPFVITTAADDERRRRRQVIAVGAGLYALSGPGQTAGFSVFVDPLTDAFGISRSELTAAYLVATLAAAPAGFWIGRHLDRFRPATMMRLVSAALALSLVVTAAAPVLIVLVVGMFGLRAFGQGGLTLTSSVFVAKSITARRGAALGILTAVGGFAIALTPLGASRLIPLIGWRQTWLVLAGVVAVGGWLLARAAANPTAHPVTPTDASDTEQPDTASTSPSEHTLSKDARRRQQWGFAVVAAGYATTGAVVTALAFHQVAVLGERGLSTTAAATNFLPQSVAAATTAVIVGRMVDRVPGRVVVPINMMLLLAGLASLWAVRSPMTAILFGVLLGTAAAANGASEGALVARWTGTATLGKMRGRLIAIMVASTAVSPLLFTLVADALGSFTRAAAVAMLLPIGVALLALRAPLPNTSDMAEYAHERIAP